MVVLDLDGCLFKCIFIGWSLITPGAGSPCGLPRFRIGRGNAAEETIVKISQLGRSVYTYVVCARIYAKLTLKYVAQLARENVS